MPKFRAELSRTMSVEVEVEADDLNAAADKVTRKDYPLPSRDEWTGHEDWTVNVWSTDGNEVLAVLIWDGGKKDLSENQAKDTS